MLFRALRNSKYTFPLTRKRQGWEDRSIFKEGSVTHLKQKRIRDPERRLKQRILIPYKHEKGYEPLNRAIKTPSTRLKQALKKP